jgi:hypothetical protein
MVMATDEQLWYGMASKPAKADPLAEARKKAREEEEAAAKAEEEEFKQKTADILRGPKAAAKSLAKSAAMIAADPMGANPEAAAEVVERGAEYLGKGYDYLKEKISPEEVAGPAAAIAAFDPELFRGSKITTETGEPLTVYHGTPPGWDAEGRAVPRSFRDFDPSMFGHQYGQRFGPGIYFSTAPATASRYAAQMPTEAYFPEGSDLPEMRHPALSPERDPEGFTRVKDSGDRKMGGSVLRAAVTIKNPYDWPSSGDRAVGGLHGLVVERERLPDDIHDAVVARAGFDPSRKTNWKLHPKFEDLYVPFGTPRTHTTNLSEIHLEERAMQIMGDALKEELTSRGHDGIRITQPTYGHRYVRDPEWRLDESGEWRQVEPSKVAPTQEAYRTGTEQEIVAFHPEQVRQAPRAAAPEAPRVLPPVESLFDQEAPRQIEFRRGYGGSRDEAMLAVYLSPQEFLSLAQDIETVNPEVSAKKAENIRQLIESGTKIEQVPELYIRPDGQITGHEGRHRAAALAELGYDKIPVLIQSRSGETRKAIRWGMQRDPNAWNYQELPAQLIGEDGRASIDSPFHTEGPNRGLPLPDRDPFPERRRPVTTSSPGRPKRGGAGTVGTIGGLAGLGISGVLAAQAAKGAVPEEVRESGVEAFYRFKGGKPVEARELDPKSKAVQAFVENEEALQWALQNNRISEDAYKQLSSLRK